MIVRLDRAGRATLSRHLPFLKTLTRGYKMARASVRNAVWPRSQCFRVCRSMFRERIGIEIGGPSSLFDRYGLFPIYPLLARLDNCNFAHETIWEGGIREGEHFRYDRSRQPGCQYVREAGDLNGIPSGRYDVALSSHCLEHTANPLRALREWLRVLKENALIVLVVPHRDAACDHRRPVTRLAHLIDDFKRDVGEDDRTHLAEILDLHDRERDAGRPTREDFVRRSEDNVSNRSLHHHVFVTETVVQIMDHLGLQVCAVEPLRPLHIVAVAKKLPCGTIPDNRSVLGERASYRLRSPFPSDRPAVPSGSTA